MGEINHGMNGGVSGKVGSVVGSSWRDINYLKGLPKISKKPKTAKQLEQQARFSLATRMLSPVAEYLRLGFSDVKHGRCTGYNVAVRNFLASAITGSSPDLEIDYPKVQFAKGTLSRAVDVVVTPEAGKLAISWTSDIIKLAMRVDDELIVLVYEPLSNEYVVGPVNVQRQALTTDVAMPSDWSGLTVHVYVFFTSLTRDKASNSTYAGNVTVF